MTDINQVHGMASSARLVLNRLADDGGLLDQIIAGQWDGDLDRPTQLIDAFEVLEDLREAERTGRITLDRIRTGLKSEEPSIWPGWDDGELGSDADDARTALYRRAQSRWRETVLHLRPGRSDGGTLVGNMLRADAPADAQWLTPEVATYARARLAQSLPGDAPLNDRRLLRNLLSSMPLCFNVFGHLNAYPAAAARVLSRLLDMDIADVGPMRVEHAPVAGHARLRDRTAFDAYVPYATSEGAAGFLAIETKYTELFSQTIYEPDNYFTITDSPGAWFVEGAGEGLKGAATNQLWRNTMLAQLAQELDGVGVGTVVVLALDGDRHAKKAVDGVAAYLREPGLRLRSVSYETLAELAHREPELAYWAHLLSARYLHVESR